MAISRSNTELKGTKTCEGTRKKVGELRGGFSLQVDNHGKIYNIN